MSGIPSDIAGSSLQAGFQARNVAKARDAERAQQASASSDRTKGVDAAGETVETSDKDAQVYADAEGTGSQGRMSEEELLEEDESQDSSDDPPDDQTHLDVQA